MPFLFLFTLFIVLPLAEIAVYIWVGGAIGLWPTLALTVLAALVGALLARREGFATLRATTAALDRGEIPVAEIVSGAVLLVASVMLVTPGFISDGLGLMLLLRPVRLGVGRWVLRRFMAARQRRRPDGQRYIDVRVVEIDPDRK